MNEPQLTPEQRESLAGALYAGNKLEAIKVLREASGLGLKESKEIIERLEAELRAAHPDRFKQPAARKGLSIGLILTILIVDAVIVIFFLLFRR